MFQLNLNDYETQSVNDTTTINSLWPTVQLETHRNRNDEPAKSEILLQLGILYWRRGEFDRSEQLIVKAREVADNDKDVQFLAQCFIGLALVKNSLEKNDDAIGAYEQAIRLVPDNFHLWNNLGNLYQKNNKYEQAHNAFKEALRVDPSDIVAWTGLANTHDKNGSIDEAINAYKRAIVLMSKSDCGKLDSNKQLISSYLRLAVLYTKKCQYQKAIDAYKKVLAFDGKKTEIWKEVGALYLKMEAYKEATNVFSKVVEMDLNNGQAHLNLAFAFSKLGQHKNCVTHCLESIELLKDQNDKQHALDLLEEAVRTIQKHRIPRNIKKSGDLGVEFLPFSDVAWFYYEYNQEITSTSFAYATNDLKQLVTKTANDFTNNGHVNPAKESTVKKVEKGEKEMPSKLLFSSENPTQVELEKTSQYSKNMEIRHLALVEWNEKGNIHFNNKAYQDALLAYSKAIEIDPTFGPAYNNLALIYFLLGNYDEAISQYQKSINFLSTDKEKAIAWNGLGNAYRCVKNYKSAYFAYQNASELDKANGGVYDNTISYEVSGKDKNADFWNDLGKLFFKVGAYDKAASAFQEAIQLEPSSGQAYSSLARAFTAQGKYQEAVSLYHKSIDLIPNNKEKANAWNRLGDVHRKLNDYDNARKAYQNGTALTNNEFNLLSRTRFSLLSNCAAKQ